MIAKLKKLEATDNGMAYAEDYRAAYETLAERASHEVPPAPDAQPSAELQMLAVPRKGWLNGPGRHFTNH